MEATAHIERVEQIHPTYFFCRKEVILLLRRMNRTYWRCTHTYVAPPRPDITLMTNRVGIIDDHGVKIQGI
jgi:hypothetical protein